MTEPDPLLPFSRRPTVPAELRPPTIIVIGLVAALAGGGLLGLTASTGSVPYRVLRGIFFASAFAYLVLSLFDFWEHFRLEKAATGRWWSMTVLPPGETLNHIATGTVVIALFVFARPLPSVLAARDWFVIFAPALFLALGWRDEIVYHRRRWFRS